MIPRIIHQIWLGQDLPPEIQKRMEGVRRMNNTFQYKVYRDTSAFKNDAYIQWALSNRSATAFIVDRMRLLALTQDGGIYVDADCRACRPLSTLDIWDDPKADFLFGMRSPDRMGVGLKGPISFVDNTVMASAKNGRLVKRLLELYRPGAQVQNGGTVGLHIIRHAHTDTRVVNFRLFYAEERLPETIFEHDAINLGSWTKKDEPRA